MCNEQHVLVALLPSFPRQILKTEENKVCHIQEQIMIQELDILI